jgi:tetratricopeptide (TPR) repeat protein
VGSSAWLQWLILSALTGSPLGSAVFLLVFWFVVDRFTLGLLPDPVRWVMRRRRAAQLERTLQLNPHDGRARLELAGLYVDRRRYADAVNLLKPNLEKGDDDASTLFTMGVACLGAGYAPQGEALLEKVEEIHPGFRVHEVELARGRFRLARKDFAGAKEALERFVQKRSGTIEGRVLLARSLEGLGDDGSGALMKDAAWHEYVVAPRFQRRQERFWAWRARPSRPVAYAAMLAVGLALFATLVVPRINAWRAEAQRRQGGAYMDPGLADPDE